MLIRITLISALALSLAGCSNSANVNGPSGLSNANLHPISSAQASEISPIDIEAELIANRTLSGKMLTAIALERVTGRKPDPARFSQAN